MTALVLSQPMFMPWRGMFEQIRLSDVFVFYDTVQLPLGGGKGRGFITRVQIKTERGIEWLSLPVQRSGNGKQLIKDARFADVEWKSQHLAAIDRAYRRAPHYQEVFDAVVSPIYAFETKSVSAFCMNSMRLICDYISLPFKPLVSSSLTLSLEGDASHRVLAVCKMFEADRYISGHGAMHYIDHDLFESGQVGIEYMKYRLTPYPQLHGAFNPYVSMVDVLFNNGRESLALLDSSPLHWKHWPETELRRRNA